MINSCKKDTSEVSIKLSSNEVIQSSKFYDKNVVTIETNRFSKMTPNWDKAYINEEKAYTVYEVGLENTENFIMSTSNVSKESFNKHFSNQEIRLLMFKDKKTEKLKFFCYMVIENLGKTSNNNFHYKKPGEFSGKIMFYSPNGKLTNGWVYNNGNITKLLTSVPKETLPNKIPHSDKTDNGSDPNVVVMKEDANANCTETIWYVNELICYGENCHWIEIDSFVVKECQSSGGDGEQHGGGEELEPTDPLQAFNKLCSSSFNFSQVVAPGQGSRGWKEASVKDLTINVMARNYFENVWNTIVGGTLGKFSLTVGVPGDLPSANVAKEAGIAINKAMVDIYRSYGSEGVKGLINTGLIGPKIAALAEIQLNSAISGAKVTNGISGRVTPTSPIIGTNCL